MITPTYVAGDRPLIVQFAANNGADLADAAEIVAPYVFIKFALVFCTPALSTSVAFKLFNSCSIENFQVCFHQETKTRHCCFWTQGYFFCPEVGRKISSLWIFMPSAAKPVLYEISESWNIGTIPKFYAWNIGITMQWVRKSPCFSLFYEPKTSWFPFLLKVSSVFNIW